MSVSQRGLIQVLQKYKEDRVPKKFLDQHPRGRRKPGRPRKRWLDDVTKDLAALGIRGWWRRVLDRKEWAKERLTTGWTTEGSEFESR
jgi:hypothetical protein